VLAASALEGTGVDEVWDAVQELESQVRDDGRLDAVRADQAVSWMWDEIRESVLDAFLADADVAVQLPEVEAAVRAGSLSPTGAARNLLRRGR
jgi:LAO/AO transport system kinase